MGHRKFFKILSRNLEYVKRFCNDITNPFHFAIRESTNTVVNDDGLIEFYLIKRSLLI